MYSSEELRAFADLLRNNLTITALPPERQQELLLKGLVAALEESAAGEIGPKTDESLSPSALLGETAAFHPLENVRSQAFQALVRLAQVDQSTAIDILYRLSVEEGLLAARQMIITRGWQPVKPPLRALFDWFTQLETNQPFPEEALPLLTQAYFFDSSPALQRRLLATAVQNGAGNWQRIINAIQTGTQESLADLVEHYSSFRPTERQITLEQLDRLAAQGSAAARDTLVMLFIRHEDPQARKIISDREYLPEDLEQRALFYFLAEKWAEYESLDFNHSLLLNAYETAGKSLRRRLLEHSRQTGQLEWIRDSGSSGEVRWLSDLTDADWDLSIRHLTEGQKFAELWRLAQVAPPIWSAAILGRLVKANWAPENEDEKTSFTRLAEFAEECRATPLTVRPKKSLRAPVTEYTCLAMHPGGGIIAAGSSNQQIYQWDLPDGDQHEPVLIGPSPVTRALVYSPDGEIIATASGDNRIRAFRLAGGQVIKTFEGHRAMIRSLAVHPDGRTLYSAGFDGSIRFWRFPHGAELKTLKPGPAEIFSMVIGANGTHLISAGADCLVRVWNLPEGTSARELTGHTKTITHLAASQSSELVASAGRDNLIRVWNFSSGGLVRTITDAGSPLTALCMHVNDQVLIGGRSNGEITLWSLSTGKVIDQLAGHQDPITGFTLSKQGDTLYSADSKGHLQAWDLHTFLTIRLPGEVARPGATLELQNRLKNPHLSPAERKWLTFAAELARWHQRFDIELAEFNTIQIGDFDIEL